MWKRTLFLLLVALVWTGTAHAQVLFDITNPGDPIEGVPNDGDWPGNEAPPLAIDNQISGFKYLHFKGDFAPDPGTGGTGFRVTPSGPSVVITALNFATANDATPRDPISFRLSGSDVSIDGPYILIAEGTIDEMSQATPHPRNTWISEPVPITNNKVYTHYELIFTDIRDRAAANSMQIGEVELLSDGSLPGAASSPNPAKEEIDVLRDVVLTWDAGTFAATRNVYLSTNFNDVNEGAAGALIADGITETSVDPGRLPFGETFYWRVDEANSAPDFTVFTGEVWSFTVEPIGFPIANITATASSSFGVSGPERTIDGSGMVGDLHGVSASDMWISGAIPATIEYAFDRAYKLHELWIWNSNQLIEAFVGFGAKDVVIEHSLDGENWTVLDGVGPLAQAPGTEGYAQNNTIAFGGITAQFVRIAISSVQGIAPQVSLSEVRFLFIPTFATRPNPDSGATDVAPDSALSWGRNGREADRHEVYVGADPDNLALAGGVSESSFDTLALDLQLGQSYAWRVDEVNEAMDPSIWKGIVWSFTTADTIPIDDMESYKDAEFLEIWATWVDGFDDPANGSLVG
ncbi:MAG: discoidin domain-containing protein, partial [Planctomycetes bacterium]|nr:discoidin domain-containing protein [Planctomycetota bacterium]